jgi:hypothetical protein
MKQTEKGRSKGSYYYIPLDCYGVYIPRRWACIHFQQLLFIHLRDPAFCDDEDWDGTRVIFHEQEGIFHLLLLL